MADDPTPQSRFASHPTVQQFNLARMKPDHLDEVAAIDQASFDHPWPRSAFEREIAQGHSHPLVCLTGDRVVGYICPWLVSEEVQIQRLAVDPAFRRRGAAAALLRAVVERAYDVGAHWIYLEVEEGNLAAESLYQGLGFTLEGLRPDYYGRGRHALVMVLDLTTEWDGDAD
ncbi:MAG: ribosomal-protein-alanine N-acetyltransferase [Nitrospirae bacterium]|nr:MAG: ribosomal-protein-alanine N-acetyltransferase [Nitrospirota bacterium]